jgi:hypothetical protein
MYFPGVASSYTAGADAVPNTIRGNTEAEVSVSMGNNAGNLPDHDAVKAAVRST